MECVDTVICMDCFAEGREGGAHQNNHDYIVEQNLQELKLYDDEFGADEELIMIDGCKRLGFENWTYVVVLRVGVCACCIHSSSSN